MFRLAVALMVVGILIVIAGAVVANRAVIQMSKRLDAKYKKLRKRQWWNVIGAGSTHVISEYRATAWSDAIPSLRLRRGYQLMATGFAMMLGASVLGNYFRGSF
ncbi:hypothetical protein ACFQBQ_17280 [Granulicella cerasi]|uniref:Uncharacterized protein n=1 Tax=Granulicella cerasi TaxID=741063 RepID=A0ABW1ZCV2_9BACT|nr:hypothetical protein [Granulicella cerasi]